MTSANWDPSRLMAPGGCLACDNPAGPALCTTCLDLLEDISGRGCSTCGNPSVHAEAESCRWCDRLSHLPNHIGTAYAYREVGRDIYHRVKYQGYYRLVRSLLARAQSGFFKTVPFLQYASLVPIPESFQRKLVRYFNPAELIASEVALFTGLPVVSGLSLKPFRKHQVGLGYTQRRRNVADRFRVSRALEGPVILVDDVLTTGATLEAATVALHKAGIKQVAWYCLFRTL